MEIECSICARLPRQPFLANYKHLLKTLATESLTVKSIDERIHIVNKLPPKHARPPSIFQLAHQRPVVEEHHKSRVSIF